MRQRLINILEQASKSYDYLKTYTGDTNSTDELSEQVQQLFWHILEREKMLQQKYDKLLRLHNNLIESNSGLDSKYNAEYIYRLADENEYLKSELAKTINKKSTLKPPNKTNRRIEMLEKKVIALEMLKPKTYQNKRNKI